MTRRILLTAAALGVLLMLPASARAQSAFAGVVKDATGAVLPGVTVEAASPALIEQVRTVTTDSNGAYKIENLRPGLYTLTFSLPGFSSVKRDAVELASNFTSTINAELKVGAMEETVTVSSTAPTFISALIVAVKFDWSSMPSFLTVENPGRLNVRT